MAECVHTMKPTGFVYFIASPALRAIKIGYSAKHPVTRLKALQTGNADELEMIGWCAGTVALEQHWHRYFGDYWIRGEWFRLEGGIAEFIRAFREHYWRGA
jgi:hypothetical protein